MKYLNSRFSAFTLQEILISLLITSLLVLLCFKLFILINLWVSNSIKKEIDLISTTQHKIFTERYSHHNKTQVVTNRNVLNIPFERLSIKK